jgi:hypothetical protein
VGQRCQWRRKHVARGSFACAASAGLHRRSIVKTYSDKLPIYALPSTIEKLKGAEGNLWRSLMERWTNHSTLGTQVVLPNTPVQHGQVHAGL